MEIKFGDRLRAARGMAGLNVRELEGLSGVTALGSFESGARERPSVSTLERLAEVLGCRAGWLLDGSGDPPTIEEVRAAVASVREKTGVLVVEGRPE